jgi:hypothetical protein
MCTNSLKLNQDKTEFIVFTLKTQLKKSFLHQINFEAAAIGKNVGVFFDNHKTWRCVF